MLLIVVGGIGIMRRNDRYDVDKSQTNPRI
jgi:hypothetical protein